MCFIIPFQIKQYYRYSKHKNFFIKVGTTVGCILSLFVVLYIHFHIKSGRAPENTKEAKTLGMAQKLIKEFCKKTTGQMSDKEEMQEETERGNWKTLEYGRMQNMKVAYSGETWPENVSGQRKTCMKSYRNKIYRIVQSLLLTITWPPPFLLESAYLPHNPTTHILRPQVLLVTLRPGLSELFNLKQDMFLVPFQTFLVPLPGLVPVVEKCWSIQHLNENCIAMVHL